MKKEGGKNLVIWVLIFLIIINLVVSFLIYRNTLLTGPLLSPWRLPSPESPGLTTECGSCQVNPDHVNDAINACLNYHDGVASSSSYNNCANYANCAGGCGVIITCGDGNIQSVGGECPSSSASV